MAVITVLGAGMMGSALCVPLADQGHDVRLVGTHLDRDIIYSLQASHKHPGIPQPLPASIKPLFREDLPYAMEGVDVVALGVSSAGVRWAAQQLRPFLRPGLPIVSITKGLDWDGDRFQILPDVLRAQWPQEVQEHLSPAAIAGPCIAGELAARRETAVVLTGRDDAILQQLQGMLQTDYYFVRTSTDVVGVEVCAALKNAFAMSIGFAAGIHESRGGQAGSVAMHNFEAAVYTQASLEMARMVEIMGGQASSIWGLAGIGDLLVTCNGGRTSRLGRWLGTGLNLDQAVAKMNGATLESLDILRVIGQGLPGWEADGVLGATELPLLRHLLEIVLEGKTVDMPFSRFF